MVADVTDKKTVQVLKRVWEAMNHERREVLLNHIGHSTKHAYLGFDDLTGEIQSKIATSTFYVNVSDTKKAINGVIEWVDKRLSEERVKRQSSAKDLQDLAQFGGKIRAYKEMKALLEERFKDLK